MRYRFINWEKYQLRKDYKRPWWFAFANDFFTNPNFLDFCPLQRNAFTYLLCLASQQAKHGEFVFDLSLYLVLTKMKKEIATKTIDKLLELKVLQLVCTESVQCTVQTTVPTDSTDSTDSTGDMSSGEDMESTPDEGSPKAILALWNERADPTLPRASDLTAARERLARARLKDYPDADTWADAIDRINASKFCLGKVPFDPKKRSKAWKADFDWFIKPDTFVKLFEGKFDNK